GHLAFAGPASGVADERLVRVRGRRAGRARHPYPIVAEVVEPERGEVGDDIRGDVRTRVVDFVEELVAHRIEVDPAAGAPGLRDHGGAVGLTLGDRVGEVPRFADRPPLAGEVAACRLAGTLAEMPDRDALRQPVPVVVVPAELVDER